MSSGISPVESNEKFSLLGDWVLVAVVCALLDSLADLMFGAREDFLLKSSEMTLKLDWSTEAI